VVNREVVREHLLRELPFLACERVLMEAVRSGGDRQELHERLRRHAQAALGEVKAGRANDLFPRLAADPAFAPHVTRRLLDPRLHVGLAAEQTEEFLTEAVTPALRRHRRRLGRPVELEA